MPSAKPKHRISARAKRMWDRLQNWYGDALDQYGPHAPEDWCESIDSLPDLEAERAVLAEIRANHPTFPPRFPEFDAICAHARSPRPGAVIGDSLHQRLCDYALRAHSGLQAWKPWSYERRGGQVTAVNIPREDGSTLRVTVEEYLANNRTET